MSELISPEALSAFFQVIFIDLVLAGDNAIVIGLAASGLPREQRNRAILVGIIAATVLRIIFASITTWLLAIVGLLVAGGILLLWVCWKMWRELREQATHDQAEAEKELELAMSIEHGQGPSPEELGIKRKTFGAALLQIMIADVTMSLDNVLAVAGAAHDHPWIMVFGLVLSIALMGVAATFIAKILTKHRWIGYVGLVIVLYVALHMIWDGYRSTTVRALAVAQHNSYAPAFLDLSDHEIEEFCEPEVGARRALCLAQAEPEPLPVAPAAPAGSPPAARTPQASAT